MLIKCYATVTILKTFFFSMPTVMVCATSDGGPPFYAMYTLYHTAHVATTLAHPATLSPTARSMPCLLSAVVIVGKGLVRQGRSQKAGGLPIVTNGGDQTKIQVILHVFSPTKPYQDLCSRCERHWCIWFGSRSLTNTYHTADLAGPPFSDTITKPYHLAC